MLTISIEIIIVSLVIVGLACAVVGYLYAQSQQRRAGGGRTAQELRDEIEQYRGNVNEHFQTTASLLNNMTEQYRAVYEHMATGAQTLCDSDATAPQIDVLHTGRLPEPAPEESREDDEGAEETSTGLEQPDIANFDTEVPVNEADAAGAKVESIETQETIPEDAISPVDKDGARDGEVEAPPTKQQ